MTVIVGHSRRRGLTDLDFLLFITSHYFMNLRCVIADRSGRTEVQKDKNSVVFYAGDER